MSTAKSARARFISAMSGLVGAGLVSCLYGGIGLDTYLDRLKSVITWQHFAVGLIKAAHDCGLMAETSRHDEHSHVAGPLSQSLQDLMATVRRRGVDNVDVTECVFPGERRRRLDQRAMERLDRGLLPEYRTDDVNLQHCLIASTTVLMPSPKLVSGRQPHAASIAEISATTSDISFMRFSSRAR